MAISPALAASAYQAVAKIGADSAASSAAGTAAASAPDFSQFLSHAVNDAVGTMKQGEQMAAQQATGKGDIVNVVNAVNAAELSLDTVVAIRDKVIPPIKASCRCRSSSKRRALIMSPSDSIDFARQAIWVLLEIATPAMLTALVVGLGIGLLAGADADPGNDAGVRAQDPRHLRGAADHPALCRRRHERPDDRHRRAHFGVLNDHPSRQSLRFAPHLPAGVFAGGRDGDAAAGRSARRAYRRASAWRWRSPSPLRWRRLSRRPMAARRRNRFSRSAC